MTDWEAAWVREYVWPQPLRRAYKDTPDLYHHCSCQYGPSGHCLASNHAQCTAGPPLPGPDTYVLRRGGTHPARFDRDHFHRAASRTGRHRHSDAAVWLADRICRWRCPCDCHPPEPQRVAAPTQLTLLDQTLEPTP